METMVGRIFFMYYIIDPYIIYYYLGIRCQITA